MFCPDSTDLRIRGEFNAHKVKLLGVSLKLCDPASGIACTTPPAGYFDGNFMVILHNQSWFNINKYGEDSVIKESKLMWVPIEKVVPTASKPVEVAASISVTEVKLQDKLVDFGDSSEFSENIFDFQI